MAKSQQFIKFTLVGILLVYLSQTNASFPYYGTKIGSLKRLHHGVSGDVYAVDSRTIFVKNFNYDGEAPAAYFYVGNSNKPSNEGAVRLRDERGSTAALVRRYRNKDITLSLPDSKTLANIKWFSVWCDEFAVNFGDVAIPSSLDYPRPQKISPLKGVHGVSSDQIVIVDAQTLLVPNFSYDGEAPDAKFWVGRGQRPTAQGLRIPDENGTESPLRRYDRKTIVLTLPGDLTIFDIGHFGIWCEAFTVDFGHVRIPEGLNVPPSLKMLGISPQSKLNCEVLYDDLAFEVRWAVAGESIVMQLVAKLANNEYMSFGISPAKNRTEMIGADVVVAWVDQETGKGFAQDYFLDDKSQCSGGRGSCPDVNIQDNTNSIRLLNAAMVNGYSIVTYQRSLQATDKYDLPIAVNSSQAIVWAIGPLNQRKETSFHSQYTKQTHLIDFGRQPTWNCPMPDSKPTDDSDESADLHGDSSQLGSTTPTHEPEEEFYDKRPQALQQNKLQTNRRSETTAKPEATPKPANTDAAWDIPAIQCYEPEDGVFYAQMGPTGGKHGYPAITGHVGWGISWYINGLLIPEIHVLRGKSYTFVVEGGNNPDIPAKYHPFYITDDPIGGYEHKRDEEKRSVRIFAGVNRSRTGKLTPIGVGRLCNWTPDVDGPSADDFQSFGAYQRTLTLKCDPGEPGVITWKPDSNTPDTVYYHCFTHRYLGWKIHVHDTCDDVPYAASEKHEVSLPADASTLEEDISAEASIRHETKVSPNDNFLLKHQTDLIKNHNMNGTPPKLTFEITKSTEITKLISDGIRAAEALEESILKNKQTTADSGAPASQYKYNSLHSLTTYQQSQHQPATLNAISPQRPHISTEEEQILLGEAQSVLQQNLHSQQKTHSQSPFPSQTHSQSQTHLHHPHHHQQHPNVTNFSVQPQKTIGLSEYLRPPQNAPLFRPVKLPGRRPFPSPIKKTPQTKPVLPQQLHRYPVKQQANAVIPQPSVIVSHYRKPVPGILKPFVKEPSFPIQPIAASVLLLGQPTELVKQRKTDPFHHSMPKPVFPVPYGDSVPQDSVHLNSFQNANGKHEHKAVYPTKLPFERQPLEKVKSILAASATVPAPVFKKPFDVHEVKEDPPSLDIATMKPAVNIGFKPDSVVVESGFRPILHQIPDDDLPSADQPIAHRREDPGTEIDEAMETDTLFLAASKDAQSLNFEPMFIPSPPDITNNTIIRKIISSPPVLSAALPLIRTVGSAATEGTELRKPSSLEEVLSGLQSEEADELMAYDEVTGRSEVDDNEVENHDSRHEMDMDEKAPSDVNNGHSDNNNEHDKEAQAAERIDTYYLPPDNRSIPHATLPSGAVVTYDGKAVLDTSLVLPPKLEARSIPLRQTNQGLSKTEELVRNTPQFGPFRGERPPIPDLLPTNTQIVLRRMETNYPSEERENGPASPSNISTTFVSNPHLSSSSPKTTKLRSLTKITVEKNSRSYS